MGEAVVELSTGSPGSAGERDAIGSSLLVALLVAAVAVSLAVWSLDGPTGCPSKRRGEQHGRTHPGPCRGGDRGTEVPCGPVGVPTKAARCRLAAGDDIELVDFALRRTHGVDAGMAVARLSAMAGFAATSNVEAARRFGLRAAGTMAHSYVEAFPTEADAFRAYAEDRPASRTFLVDTYDTLDGVRTAIAVIDELGLTSHSRFASTAATSRRSPARRDACWTRPGTPM